MPGKPNKPHRIRVRTLDGKRRSNDERNKLKSNRLKMSYLDIVVSNVDAELIICAQTEMQLEDLRKKLEGVGLKEIGGDTTIALTPSTKSQTKSQTKKQRNGGHQAGQGGCSQTPEANKADLKKKPYGFVSLPAHLTTATPIWHDGTTREGKLSGEIRFELVSLTPLLVGWERGQVGDSEGDWPLLQGSIDGVGQLKDKKSVLCPLRAPWGKRPVIIPGDSLKGLLRHELGALLGAPMERVAERSYSYRPNALFPKDANPRLVARLAQVPEGGVETRVFDESHQVRVPTRLELLSTDLKYDKNHVKTSDYYRFDDGNGAPYRGGQGSGEKLNSRCKLHSKITANPSQPTERVSVPLAVQEGYLATLRHLTSLEHGHFSERHPDVPNTDVPNTVEGDHACARILEAAKNVVFQPGDLIWVEWDMDKKCIVSLGWHYYYRWAYTDSIRKKGDTLERHGLFPLEDERSYDGDGAPKALSLVRRLFGYTGDNEGSADIGEGDHEQLMGRLFPNAALEVVEDGDTDEKRFLPPTFLKELGMPRPSAVEYYVQQPDHPRPRPSDKAVLVTYGDAVGYDRPGDLAGRKFYLDREEAYTGEPWEDDSANNRDNARSTLALEASKSGRRFRFTLRFRDLDPAELAAVLVALCPDQFKAMLGGDHADGYCSKLGYARPLGWGSMCIQAKELHWLQALAKGPVMTPEVDLIGWVDDHYTKTASQKEWLAIHRQKHPDAADYPKKDGKIYTFHSSLRAEHSRARRYRKKEG